MKLTDQIRHIESKIDVGSIKVHFHGRIFQVYPWLKVKLFYKLITGSESMAKADKAMLLRQVKSLFSGFLNWFKAYDIWAFSNNQERIAVDGQYYHKIFDSIEGIVDASILHIELQLFKTFKRKEIKSKHLVSKSFFLLQEEFISRLFLRDVKIENSALIQQICAELNVEVAPQKILKKVLSQYLVMKFWLKVFKKPKLVLLTVGYSNFGYILAFKEHKIPVIEFQHGVISQGHHGYYYHQALQTDNFPDSIALWGQEECDFISKNSQIPIPTVAAVGRSIIDLYGQDETLTQEPTRVCVVLQDLQLSNELLEVLIGLNHKLGQKFDFYLQTRRASEAYYNTLYTLPKNFHFYHGPIYENILQSAIHITVYSSSALESLALGTMNIFYDSSGRAQEIFHEKLAANPFCHFIKNQTDLLTFFNEVSIPPISEVKNASKNIYTTNASEHIKMLLDKYLN